ncbi:MAG: outer membrane beta-barrel protein [Lacipirellulaceae bacterium]
MSASPTFLRLPLAAPRLRCAQWLVLVTMIASGAHAAEQRRALPAPQQPVAQQPVTRVAAADEPPLVAPADSTPTLIEESTQLETHPASPEVPADAPWGDSPPESPPEGIECADGIGAQPSYRHWLLDQGALRHSSTHGRAMGFGMPLRGTSWLNRPYDVAVEFGSFVMLTDPADGVEHGNDLFGAASIGWDWDHYWGSQMRIGWSTPELTAEGVSTATDASDNLFLYDASLLYYPWGDSRLRPYWRVGVGLTDIEYTTAAGREHDMLFTLPFGGGLKYQFRHWLVWRAEVMDNFALGMNDTDSLHNLTFSTGLEWRFGGRPAGYWAWAGRGGSW